MLGVKLSEAQSYLVKSSEYVHMVICDGFNHMHNQNSLINENGVNVINGSTPKQPAINASPFPRPPAPLPPIRQTNHLYDTSNGTPVLHTNGSAKTNGHVNDNVDFVSPSVYKNKIPVPNKLPVAVSSSSCNYDNLRNIDSDDSRLTSPDTLNNYAFNSNMSDKTNGKLANSISFSNGTTNGTNGVHKPNNNNSTPINNANTVNNIQQHTTSSLPITDKNLMSNIMNKSALNDPKSQSMFTNNNTPVAPVS